MNQVNEHELTVMVHIDGRLFRNFALFDTFRRQRKWVSPALFAAIMIGFSCVCFALRGQAEQAVLLGGTLLAVGLLLPAAYLPQLFSLGPHPGQKARPNHPTACIYSCLSGAGRRIRLYRPGTGFLFLGAVICRLSGPGRNLSVCRAPKGLPVACRPDCRRGRWLVGASLHKAAPKEPPCHVTGNVPMPRLN